MLWYDWCEIHTLMLQSDRCKKQRCYLPAGRSVWWKTVTEVLKMLPEAVKIQIFYFEVVRVCSFAVCCNDVCKSGLSPTKTKFEWYTPTRHKGINAAFSHWIPSVSVVQFTVQMFKLKGLTKTHRERLFVVELKLKLRSLFHYNQIVWDNSDIKWMKVPSIISAVTKYLTF